MKHLNIAMILAILSFTCAGFSPAQTIYRDGRPSATLRMEAKDQGVVLKHGESDSAAACSPWVHFDGKEWHMFYLGTPNASGAPDLVPSFPYLTLKARSKSLAGPWIKQPDVIPFRTKPKTYYADTASPGHIVQQGDEYLMFRT